MRRQSLVALVLLLGLTPAADPLALDPQSRLWIDGKSTMRRFSCRATTFAVDVDAAPGGVAAVLAGTKGVRSVVVKVPAEKLECGNGTMNEHMLKALKSKEAPTIEFTLSSYEVAKSEAGARGTMSGTLAVGGVQRPITIAAQAAEAGPGGLRVTGAYELHMKEFGLKPPTLMMGTLKVDELVTVNFDLVLKSSAVAALDRGN